METNCIVIFYGEALEEFKKLLLKNLDEESISRKIRHGWLLFDIIDEINQSGHLLNEFSDIAYGYVKSIYRTTMNGIDCVEIALSDVHPDVELCFKNIADKFGLQFVYKLDDLTNMIFINNDISHTIFGEEICCYV